MADSPLDLAGSGDVHLGAIAGSLDARLAGSGDVVTDRVEGSVKAELAGSSDMKINGGHAPQLAVQIAGSGDFVFNGVAGSVSASVPGSGDIHVAHAEGPVAKNLIGRERRYQRGALGEAACAPAPMGRVQSLRLTCIGLKSHPFEAMETAQ